MGRSTNTYDFERLFELSPDLLCIAGFDGYFKKVNSAVINTLGYTFEEIYSKPINHFIYQDDLQMTLEMRAILTQKHSMVSFENRYVSKSGEIIWLSWTSKADVDKEIIFGIAKNITVKKREAEDRLSHLADLSQRNKHYKNLTYTTSHDLRAPVDNMLSIFQLMDYNTLGDYNKNLMDLLENATEQLKDKLSTYIDNLGKSHSIKVDIERIDFQTCVDDVIGSIKHLIETSNAVITTNFSECAQVPFNRAYLESIFLNLISNGIKYAGAAIPQINIYSKSENGLVKLYLEDNGIGFNLEEVGEKIFGLHQTFHKNQDSKGIGLYLVYTHITSLGGAINVESSVGGGTKFTITFSRNLSA